MTFRFTKHAFRRKRVKWYSEKLISLNGQSFKRSGLIPNYCLWFQERTTSLSEFSFDNLIKFSLTSVKVISEILEES